MKILHLYPPSDSLIAQHVSLLADGLRHSAEVQASCDRSEFRALCQQMHPDILHCHGCWQYAIARTAAYARKRGVRIVVSPHGQLEPWILEGMPLQEKVGKPLLWQKRNIERAYALIAFGKMEHGHLSRLKWNPRIETIHNAVTTNSTTPQEMCSQTFSVYQKVLDSNVLEQMNEPTRRLLAAILKAGITGDRRWVREPADASGDIDWRRLLIYAEHQNIRNYTDYGISILGLSSPAIDTSKIASYFPNSYQRPARLSELTGAYNGDETDYLVSMIRQIQKQPLLLHLAELARELRRDTVNDDLLQEALRERGLYKFAARLMTVLQEQTQLDEGFMPLPPVDDRETRQIRNSINNHLKI